MSHRSLFSIIFLLLVLIASLTLVFRTTILSGQAFTTSDATPTLQNSYLFASPLRAKADNRELIRLNVFILDSRGLGVADQNVNILRPASVNITNIQSVTDDTGKAVFDLSSSAADKYQIAAQVNSREIPQKVTVTFY